MADKGIISDYIWEIEKAKRLVCNFKGVGNLPKYHIASIIAKELKVEYEKTQECCHDLMCLYLKLNNIPLPNAITDRKIF